MRTVKELPPDVIERWLKDEDCEVRTAAMNACQGREDIPLEVIERGLKDKVCDVRYAAMNACQGREDIPLEVIERGLKDKYCDVRLAAINACQGREDIPLDVIERGLKDEDCVVRAAAMNACQGREDIPLDVIERGLKDEDRDVRTAAMNACQGREDISLEVISREDIPLLRAFEPPEKVYKKCLGGVIVVANIPKDAQVRGENGKKCRANKAVITDIIGEFQGEKIGVSIFDKTTMYKIGDVVEIEYFDISFAECSSGFHFFCTEGEARRYDE